MGLFGKLFEKKTCDVCGGEIGLLGNRKLADGNLCKACCNKLSPWFSDRKESTVQEIQEQLAYRVVNSEAVARFHTTRTLGRHTKVQLDENAGKFLISSASNLLEANPDVLELSQVTGCDLDIQESRSEEKRSVKQADGSTKQVSFTPPHYTYRYTFRMTVSVNHPYFSEMAFNLNNSSVEIETVGLLGGSGLRRPGMPAVDPRMANPDYAEYLALGNEIKAALTGSHGAAAQTQPQKQAVTCPSCGATTTPDENGRCEYCGSAVN